MRVLVVGLVVLLGPAVATGETAVGHTLNEWMTQLEVRRIEQLGDVLEVLAAVGLRCQGPDNTREVYGRLIVRWAENREENFGIALVRVLAAQGCRLPPLPSAR